MSSQPRRAVIVVDVQNEYFTGELQIEYPPSSQSLPRITRIMDAATAAGVPVIVIQQDSPADAPAFASGSDGWQLHPEIARRHRDALFLKPLPSAFSDTGLGEWLAQHRIDTLTVIRNYDGTPALLRAVEDAVPANAVLAVAAPIDTFLAPLAGPRLSRILRLVPHGGRVPSDAAWLASKGSSAASGCAGAWSTVYASAETHWRLLRRTAPDTCGANVSPL